MKTLDMIVANAIIYLLNKILDKETHVQFLREKFDLFEAARNKSLYSNEP